MTEAEWLVCKRPRPMLVCIGGGLAGERELRLFAVACLREISGSLPCEVKEVVDAHEAFADELIDELELSSSIAEAERFMDDDNGDGLNWIHVRGAFGPRPWLAANILRPNSVAEWTGGVACQSARRSGPNGPSMYRWGRLVSYGDRGTFAEQAMRKAQSDLLRELFGNPFRKRTFDPAWFTWNGGTIPSLAWAIYEEKAFDRLPILGDALEEAGCSDSEILAHCRREGGHVRGCWMLDLLLGLR